MNWQSLEIITIAGVEYVSTPDAAAYLGCSEITLKRHAAAGRITPDRVWGCANLYTQTTLDNFRPQLLERGKHRTKA